MRLNYLAYSFSLTIMYFSFMLMLPVLVALYYHETGAVLPFLLTGAAALMISITIKKVISGIAQIKSINDIKKSEGLCVVSFSWIFAIILASIPYLFFGISPVDALFEATSGITATGSTILTHFTIQILFFSGAPLHNGWAEWELSYYLLQFCLNLQLPEDKCFLQKHPGLQKINLLQE